MSKLVTAIRIALLLGVMGLFGAQLSQPVYADGSCEYDCGCDAGWNGCCVLPNGAVCLRS